MIVTITGVYNHTHQIIKENQLLLNKIKELVSNPENQNSNKYLCTGLQVEDIFLGIDFIENHVEQFPKILGNTLIIETLSHGQADFSRVLLQIFFNGKHVANLTEDVSENGKYGIFDDGTTFGPYSDYLGKFYGAFSARSVFIVYDKTPRAFEKDRLKKPSSTIVRMPIIDIDHIQGSFNTPKEDLELSKKELYVLEL